MKYFFSFIALLISAALIFSFYHFKPQPKRKRPAPLTPLVETSILNKADFQVFLESFGNVIPEKELTIVSEVQGTVLEKNDELIPGGFLIEGDTLAQIDRTNYELVVLERRAAVIEAENELELESGQQIIAKQEWELFKEEMVTTEKGKRLVLREPQMKRALARLQAAQSKLDEALLDIGRTAIKAPFNAVVMESNVEVGKFIARYAPVARLVGTDRFWVKLSVPIASLSYINLPTAGSAKSSTVTIRLNGNHGNPIQRTGHVLKLLGEISSDNRMARLVVAIEDPLDLTTKSPSRFNKILLGSYVRAEIDCGTLTGLFRIPRTAIHDNNTIWIFADGKLRYDQVTIVWQRKNDVLVKGDLDGVQLITSRLQNPLEGMAISTSADRKKPNNKKEQ